MLADQETPSFSLATSSGHMTSKRRLIDTRRRQLDVVATSCAFWVTFVELDSYPSTDPRRAIVSYWRKYVHLILVNRFGGLGLHKNIVRTLKLKKGLFFEFNAPAIRKDELSIL